MGEERTLGQVACEAYYSEPEGLPKPRGVHAWSRAASAVEREVIARLARGVAPLTWDAQGEAEMRYLASAPGTAARAVASSAMVEIDALRAALAARDAELSREREAHARLVEAADYVFGLHASDHLGCQAGDPCKVGIESLRTALAALRGAR